MRKIWFLLVAGIIFQCDSDDNRCRLTRYTYNLISYDAQGLIYTVQQFDQGEIVEDGFRKVMDYDDDNRIVRVREYKGVQLFQYFEIEYEAAKILERKYMLSQITGESFNSHITTFNLDTKGRILTVERVDYTNPLVARARDTYEYDNRGNVIKKVFTSETHPSENHVSEYEFDKKLNPLRLPGFEIRLGYDDVISDQTQNKNNIIRYRITYTGADELPFIEIGYTYNEQGYPSDHKSNTSETPAFDYDCI